MIPWRRNEVAALRFQVTRLEQKIDELLRLQQRPATAAPHLIPARGVRSGRLVALEPRKVTCVTINRAKEVVAYDQAGIPVQEYCGPFRQVGAKLLMIYHGRWLQVDNETGQHKVMKLPVTPLPETTKA